MLKWMNETACEFEELHDQLTLIDYMNAYWIYVEPSNYYGGLRTIAYVDTLEEAEKCVKEARSRIG